MSNHRDVASLICLVMTISTFCQTYFVQVKIVEFCIDNVYQYIYIFSKFEIHALQTSQVRRT